jgi:hypothetical protein
VNPISELRFNSLAGYSRGPTLALIARDLAWYEEGNEKIPRILGLVALDLTDQDYVSYVLGRDAKGRFLAVLLECSIETHDAATELLRLKIAEYAQKPPEEFHQGDESGTPPEFFHSCGPLGTTTPYLQNFKTLISARGYSPARELMGEMMRNRRSIHWDRLPAS